jgi:DnaJ-class molecular chaperone
MSIPDDALDFILDASLSAFDNVELKNVTAKKNLRLINSISDCPCCQGDKVVFNKTYGSERKCSICKGTGELNEKRARELDLESFCEFKSKSQ